MTCCKRFLYSASAADAGRLGAEQHAGAFCNGNRFVSPRWHVSFVRFVNRFDTTYRYKHFDPRGPRHRHPLRCIACFLIVSCVHSCSYCFVHSLRSCACLNTPTADCSRGLPAPASRPCHVACTDTRLRTAACTNARHHPLTCLRHTPISHYPRQPRA